MGLFRTHNKCLFVNCKWMESGAAESLVELNLSSPEVCDATWYLRDRASLMNEDLDLLHDGEILGRSFVETVEPKIYEHGLDWKNVVLVGFGKGAGIALYASLLKVFPKQLAGVSKGTGPPMKVFSIWGGRNRCTPGTYRQLLAQTVRKSGDIQFTTDNLQDGTHMFDAKSINTLTGLLPLVLP